MSHDLIPGEDNPREQEDDTRHPASTLTSLQQEDQSEPRQEYQGNVQGVEDATASRVLIDGQQEDRVASRYQKVMFNNHRQYSDSTHTGTARDEGADFTSHLSQIQEPAPSSSSNSGTMAPSVSTHGESSMGEFVESVRSGIAERVVRYRRRRAAQLRNFYRMGRGVAQRNAPEVVEIIDLDPDPVGATPQMIAEHTKVHRFGDMAQGLYSRGRCTICLCGFEETDTVRILQCNHVYHFECAEQCLMTDIRCPICRHPFANADGEN